jgi:hypothetical protein
MRRKRAKTRPFKRLATSRYECGCNVTENDDKKSKKYCSLDLACLAWMLSPTGPKIGPFDLWNLSMTASKHKIITSSRSPQMKIAVIARFQRLVLKNFRRSWYISTEDLLPTKEDCPERIHFRLQDATEVELANMNFVVQIKAWL